MRLSMKCSAYSLYFIFIYTPFWWGWQGGDGKIKNKLPLWSQKNCRTLARQDLRFIVHFGGPTMTQMWFSNFSFDLFMVNFNSYPIWVGMAGRDTGNYKIKKHCLYVVTKNNLLDLTIPMQKLVWIMMHPGYRYGQKCTGFWLAKPNHCIFWSISQATVRFFFKPIFALGPWDQDGCFECHKLYEEWKSKNE